MKTFKTLTYAVALIGLGSWIEASAGTIGGRIEDWNSWQEVAGLATGRYDAGVAVFDGYLHAVGGSIKSNVYRFNGTNWTEVQSLPVNSSGGPVVSLGTNVYYFHFLSAPARVRPHRYTGTNWSLVGGAANMETGAWEQVGGQLGANIYLQGGFYNPPGYKTNVYCFDGVTMWETNGLPATRKDGMSATLNGKMYFIGGSDGSATTNVYAYDGTNWTQEAGLPAARYYAAAGTLTGNIYVAGGMSSVISTYTNVYRFNGTNWTQIVGLPAARGRVNIGVWDGCLYLVGGVNASSEGQTNVYRYPALNYPAGVMPASGSWTGGYQVTISGNDLSDGNLADVTNVTLCGVSALSIDRVAGSTQIVVTAGQGVPGPGDVRVYSQSEGESAATNAFTYLKPQMSVRGTNGATIASGDPADAGKGTDFGLLVTGRTNTLAITNAGTDTLVISGVTTSGAGAARFRVTGLPAAVQAGTVSNFSLAFDASVEGVQTAMVAIANDSATASYIFGVQGTVHVAPTITTDPQALTVNAGASASFSVSATGTAPLLYQWQKNAVDISPATNGTYTIAAVVVGDAGEYRCRVSNAAGQATSAVATLTVTVPTLPAPTGVSASDGTYTDKVRVTWNSVTAATSYKIYRSLTNTTASASQVATTTTTAYDDTMATNWPGSALYYWAKAANAQTTSVFSAVAQGSCAPDLTAQQPLSGDFDGDLKNDLALYQESSGIWSFKLSASGYSTASATLGGAGYQPISKDFDGDGKADPTVYDTATGNWAIMLSGSGYIIARLLDFGGADCAALAGDYDGDLKADPALYESNSGTFLVKLSGSGYGTAMLSGFGGVGYISLALDFDGDGKADPAVYQSATGAWTVKLSGSGYTPANIASFGGPSYLLVSGMYDNDTRADAAIYNPANGNWTILLSASAYITGTLWGFGVAGDIPVVGDFDGDGKVDPALYQRSTSTWFVKLSGSGYSTVQARQ